jgi:tRNA (guanine-N7-)-methyltransferase
VTSAREERVPWRAVFGNDGPVEFEIGPGRGDVLLAFAAAAPARNFFAVERGARAVEGIAARAAAAGLANVRVVAGDARCVIARCVPDASVSAYHLYFPDPWPKTRHRERRMMRGGLPRELARTLVPGGVVHVASDLPAVVEDAARALGSVGFARVAAAPPPTRPVTAFERKYAGDTTHYVRLVLQPRVEEKGAPAPVVADG